MGALSFLTAVDTSLEHDLSPVDHTNNLVAVSNDEVDRVIRLWKETRGRRPHRPPIRTRSCTSTSIPWSWARLDRASSLSLKVCREILSYHLKDKAKGRPHRAAAQLRTTPPTSTRSPAARRAAWASRRSTPSSTPAAGAEPRVLRDGPARSRTTTRRTTTTTRSPILERAGQQVLYQVEKDWHYRKEERRWCPMNDVSAWYRLRRSGRVVKKKFHIR